MSIFDRLRGVAASPMAWSDEKAGTLVWRYTQGGKTFRPGSTLEVRDGQLALFVVNGVVADLFEPGVHTLDPKFLPKVVEMTAGGPLAADVYFLSTKEQLDQRWGTANPIAVRDADLGPVRLRAHGVFSYRVRNPNVLFRRLNGFPDVLTTADLETPLRSQLLTALGRALSEETLRFADLAEKQREISDKLKGTVVAAFSEYGLVLETFLLQNVSLPEGLEKSFDRAVADRMRGEDPVVRLEQLHELLKKGILTQAEFDAKKAELLPLLTGKGS